MPLFAPARLAEAATDPLAIDTDAAVLDRIVDPAVHLAVWRRAVPAGIVAPSATAPDDAWDDIDDIDQDIAVDALSGTIPALIADAGHAAPQTLAAEIVALAQRFAGIMACDTLRIRLDVIATDACRKFHADLVAARLLMPIVGPGTQWALAGTDVAIGQLRAGDVALFKGRLWAPEPVILHRSPPIATVGVTRLLLAIDPIRHGQPAPPPPA